MVARIYHQILFVNLVIEKCLKRNLSWWSSDNLTSFFIAEIRHTCQICHKENVFLNASLDFKYYQYIVHTPQGLQGAKKVSFSVASTH